MKLASNRLRLAAAICMAATFAAPQAMAVDLVETPSLAAAVAAGTLPPVAERVPAQPSIAPMDLPWQEPGQPGGRLNILMAKAKDTRQMVVYGYARLVGYTTAYEIAPDILESFEVEGGRTFTLHLRKGHKWSSGTPFTAKDFRYFWEDVANNDKISPLGPASVLIVEGEPPVVTFPDAETVIYSWSKPNPYFLSSLAGATPLYIYRSSAYLKQFHEKYADPKKLEKKVEESGQRDWAALHHVNDRQYKNENPDVPSLQPWVLKTTPPAERFVFERNPYYHRIDPQGHQLPYLDMVVMGLAGSKLIPAKAGTGEVDLQARYISFDNFSFLKDNEDQYGYKVSLWQTAKGAHLALFPNLNVNDEGWRKLLRDARFRRALSLAINRHEINEVIYFGMALESNNTVLPRSPLFKEEYQTAWAGTDIQKANELLDEMGLTQRNSEGIRLMPDGRPIEIIVETAGESTEQTDVLALVGDSWKNIGVKLFSKPSQREVFRNRIFAGDTVMSIWSGLENGLPTADLSPDELAPTAQIQLQWPKWGQYNETKGQAGEPIDMPEAQELMVLNEAWRLASTAEERTEIWHKILKIHEDQVFSIGIISGTLQPVVVNGSLRNVPEEAVYNWDPGAHFGIYRPDSFWFADAKRRTASN
jgi:peptide/nickel transport system substrate-binding protein